MKIKNHILVIILSAHLVMLTGCFTGVESTPKITARDVKRQHAASTPEMEYTSSIVGEPVGDWLNGKEFYYPGGKISFALTPISIAEGIKEGDIIHYAGLKAVKSMTDNDDSMLQFTTTAGDTLNYRIEENPESVLARTSLEIPFTIEMTLVERAAKLLEGNDYYITTPVWFNDNGDNIEGRKLIQVHIDKVTPGNTVYPLAIYFTDAHGNKSHVYMSLGTSRRATRNFETLFSLTNPRVRYKDIKDDVWDCITRSKVKPEMTREECRLSLGNPREVARGHYLERWTYDSGLILIFDDGYLQRIGHQY